MTAATPTPANVPPEAALIRARRFDTPPYPLSRRQLALDIGMSPANLARIESGEYQAKPDWLAAIAGRLGITADELEKVGREHGRENAVKAAAILRARPSATEPALAAVAGSMPESVLRAVLQGIDEIRATPGLSRREREALEAELVRGTLAYVSAHVGQIRASARDR